MIEVRLGDLETLEVDALLRPVRSDFSAVSAVGRRVERAAGPRMAERLAETGDAPLGAAVMTPGGDLPASFVIHAVVQSPEEPASEASVRRALLNGLRRAGEWGLESLALAPVGTGAGNLDPEVAARVMGAVLQEHAGEAETLRRVIIVVASEYEADIFRRVVAPGPS